MHTSITTLILSLAHTLFILAHPLLPLTDVENVPILSHDSATYNPLSALPATRRMISNGSSNVLKVDQARAQALRSRAQGNAFLDAQSHAPSAFQLDVTSRTVTYTAMVKIGSPPTSYELIIDTGSSNTWVGAGKPYIPSSSSLPTGNAFQVTYGSGACFGEEMTDKVTLADGLDLKDQSIGVALHSQGFNGFDGILGLGPKGLTCGSLFPDFTECIPTVTDTAEAQGFLDTYEVGISFRPSNEQVSKNGELTFGGVDRSKFVGDLNYVPLTTTSPASYYVGVDQYITYGSTGGTEVLRHAAGILDTGTTLILLATDAFKNYQAITGAVPDKTTGLLRISREQYTNLRSLFFHIGGVSYELTPNAQIWPRALNQQLGGDNDGIYLIINDLGSESGSGLDFINGMAFHERFYTVYDIGKSRVGLARTEHTYSESN